MSKRQNKREETENLEKGKMSATEAGRKGRAARSQCAGFSCHGLRGHRAGLSTDQPIKYKMIRKPARHMPHNVPCPFA